MFEYKRALRPGGTYAMVGGSMLRVLQLSLLGRFALLTRESRRFRLVADGPNKGLRDLRNLLETGKIIPVIDRAYSLKDVPEAMRYFGAGRHKGKIVITMDR